MTDAERLRRLAEQVRGDADPLPDWWEAAFFRAPRDLFAPEVIWLCDEDGWPCPLWRADQPERWAEAVFQNEFVITQVDGGRTPEHGVRGEESTSSCSTPSLVLEFIGHAGVRAGDRVLEIGAGTGWSSALLTAALGDGQVTTVEIDPAVAAQAAANLRSAGLSPILVVGDGAAGHPPNAPYDRVIATCAARHVPYAWVAQTRPGGVILLPFGTLFSTHQVLLRLTAHGDGTASGRFLARQVDFMGLRQESMPWRRLRDLIQCRDEAERSETDIDPRLVLPAADGGGDDIAFAVGLRAPSLRHRRLADPDGGGGTVWFFEHDADTRRATSWAAVRHEPGARRHRVEQHGPRRLWDEIEAAVDWFTAAGEPWFDEFGMTVRPNRQCCWHDAPNSAASWDLPAN